MNNPIIKYINENLDLIKLLEKRGFVSTKLFRYRDLVQSVDKYIRSGASKMEAVEWTAMDFKCTTMTVYNAINSFE